MLLASGNKKNFAENDLRTDSLAALQCKAAFLFLRRCGTDLPDVRGGSETELLRKAAEGS
jgi:hypothetical protein